MTTASALTKPAQIRLARRSPAYWRVTIDNPPIKVMGPEMVKQFHDWKPFPAFSPSVRLAVVVGQIEGSR
jgi:hypothetical protein